MPHTRTEPRRNRPDPGRLTHTAPAGPDPPRWPGSAARAQLISLFRISLVVARTSHDPALLKPSPHLITQAVEALNAEPGECTLVGDSVTDVQCALLASVQSIGYANKPGKRERLSQACAGAIINSLADLAIRFRARVTDPDLLQLSLLTSFKGARSAPRALVARNRARGNGGRSGTDTRKRARSARGEPAALQGGRSPYRDSARRRPPRQGARGTRRTG